MVFALVRSLELNPQCLRGQAGLEPAGWMDPELSEHVEVMWGEAGV